MVAAVTLTECGASSAPPTPSPTSATETAEPTDVAGTTPSPTVLPPVKTEECHLWEFALPEDPEAVAGWKQQIPVDSGPREHANGSVTVNDVGVPVVYVVAPDDWPDAIGERPRKILDWATPTEIFNEPCSQQTTPTRRTSN